MKHNHAISFAILAAITALAVAFFSQYVLDAHPCHLCVLQRYPYAAIIIVGALAFCVRTRTTWQPYLAALCVIGFLATGSIAAYHVAVEQQWIDAPDSCASNIIEGDVSLNELKEMILSAPKVSCADVGASFLGISMATWNMVYAFGCAGLIGILWKKKKH